MGSDVERPRLLSRRRLLDWMLGTSAGALLLSIAYPVLRYLCPPRVPEATTRQVEAGPVNDPELLQRGFKIVHFGAEPVILIRVAEEESRAFSATCTHLACIVEYQPVERRIWCNCHSRRYDLTGRNVAAPTRQAPSPAPRRRASVRRRGHHQRGQRDEGARGAAPRHRRRPRADRLVLVGLRAKIRGLPS